MRKTIVTFILIILILSCFIFFPFSEVNAEPTYSLIKVNTQTANIRSGAGTQNKILFQLSYGNVNLKLGTAKDQSGNIWYKIYNFNYNQTCYIASWLVKDTGVTIQGSDSSFTSRVNTEILNVRIGPGTEFDLASTLKDGDKITVKRIIKRSDGQEWYKFQGKDGKFYFIAGWYTEKVTTPPPDNQKPPETTNTASSTDYVNLRKGPSIDFEKIALIEKGDSVNVEGLAKNKNGELWLQVTYGNYTGWVISDYFETRNPPTLDLSGIGQEGITNDNLNLREGPSTGFNSLKTLSKNTSVLINGIANNKDNETWFSITSGSDSGWVLSNYIDTKKIELATINNITWLIAESGIDIIITGDNLQQPTLNKADDPSRAILTFKNTKLLKENGSVNINIYPAIRVRYESSDNDSIVTADLLRDVPSSLELKNDKTFMFHITLPKVGQKLVEIGGRDTYEEIQTINGQTNINLQDFLSAFDMSYENKYPINISFFGKNIQIEESQISNNAAGTFISLDTIQNLFGVSVLETTYTIFIDPVLEEYKAGNITTLKFSFPAATKKVNENNETTLIFYADPGKFDIENSKHRDMENAPEIQLVFQQNIELTANQNSVSIMPSEIKTGLLSGKTIVIDPGHGSYSGPYLDNGATGPTGVKESVIVLDIALRLEKLLESEGANVILTHDTIDNVNNPTLAERVSIANSSGGDLFMSIHLNASTNPSANGTETYYWYESSKAFAQAIQSSLLNKLGTDDRGVKKDYLYVCRNVTTMPAILTEVLFVSNPKEESDCKNSAFLDKVAESLETGIINYLHGQ